MFIDILISVIGLIFPLYVVRYLLEGLVEDIKTSSFWFATINIILLVYMANTYIVLLKEMYAMWV